MTVNEFFNKLNEKYDLYHYAITNADERREFYRIMEQVVHLDIPAVQIDPADWVAVVNIMNR